LIRYRLKSLLTGLGLVCVLYTLSRVLFLVFNFQSYRLAGPQELVSAFLVGLRFDIAAICRTNSVFIALSMLPFSFVEKRGYQRFLKSIFLLSNIPFLIVNVIDYEYLKFIGQRSSLSLLDMGQDISDQIGQLSFHYWYLAAIGILFTFTLYRFFPAPALKPTPNKRRSFALTRGFIAMFIVLALAVIGGRGGWQRRRFTPALAEVGDKESLAQLALNSTYTLISSQRKCDAASLSKFNYFGSDEELKRQFPSNRISARATGERRDNIVIIIVEGLSADYTGIGNPHHGFTPFLDSLAERGLYFNNSFADGRRSIDAAPSILAGIPHLRDEAFYCTQFKHLHGIGSLLKKHGYHTSFFHGGKNGTMSFDVFSLRMGFDRYYGLNEYPKPEDSDGIWGIYDEPYLQYMTRELSRTPTPFASVVFTLSTHNPYKIPPQYEGVFPKGALPIHQTVGYFDHALHKFFETAKTLPWYKNTLFVITGDHIGPAKTMSPRMIDSYRVPIVFYHPGQKLPAVDRDRIVQHVDIGPSILDFLGIATDQTLPFGHSIFDPSYDGLAIGQKGGNYWIADKHFYLEYRNGSASKLFAMAKLDAPLNDQPAIQARLEQKLKAHIQWFTNGLAEDRLYH
jgi:phosphoglycerol transferase MdoB-like AlkP superfamily enzyme